LRRGSLFKVLNLLPGSPSFADFHDALNIFNGTMNFLTIFPAYPISQFNAIAPYYPAIINYDNGKETKIIPKYYPEIVNFNNDIEEIK
jgi:hypothetical protein